MDGTLFFVSASLTCSPRPESNAYWQNDTSEELLRPAGAAKVDCASAKLPQRALIFDDIHQSRRQFNNSIRKELWRREHGREGQVSSHRNGSCGSLLKDKTDADAD